VRLPGAQRTPLTIDLDPKLVKVVGRSKQGASYGYTKKLGCHPVLATVAENGHAIASTMCGGNAGAARSAAGFFAELASRIRDAGATGQFTIRTDSALYSGAMLHKAKTTQRVCDQGRY
jgi:hypothetical protein